MYLGISEALSTEHPQRKWDYEPVSVNTYSSDESKLKFVAKVDRVARGEFAISATIDFNYTPDDTTMVSFCRQQSCSHGAPEGLELFGLQLLLSGYLCGQL